MAEKIEYDLTVNGKKAKKSIEDVEAAQNELSKTTKTSSALISKSWVAIGAGIASAGAIMGVAVTKAADLSKATSNLTDSMKNYVLETSNATGMSQELIAGFVQTGKSAKLSDAEIKTMIETATALGRAFPHESVETFIDNLTMLNTSGEAQGYIVDILEQKWGTIDLKGKDLAEMLDTVRDAADGVNENFEKAAGAKLDTVFTKAGNALTTFGTTLLDIADRWGWLEFANTKMDQLTIAMKDLNELSLNQALTARELQEQKISELEKTLNAETKILGISFKRGEASKKAIQQEIADAKMKLNSIDSQITKQAELKAKEDAASEAIIEQRQIELNKQKEIEAAKELAAKKEEERLKKEEENKKKVKNLQDQFNEDYKQSITDTTEYQLLKLGEEYLAYEKVIQDKTKLNEWFEGEAAKIMDAQKDKAKDTNDEISKYFEDTFATKLTDSLMSGEASFKDFANSIIQDIARIIIQQQIANAVSGAMGGSFFAQGGVVGGESPVQKRFATGGIVNRPTRFANGGMVGERNRAEAILPLERTSNGDLGVKAIGGNGGVVLNIENNTGFPISGDMVSSGGNKEQETINIVLSGINKNTSGIRDLLKGM